MSYLCTVITSIDLYLLLPVAVTLTSFEKPVHGHREAEIESQFLATSSGMIYADKILYVWYLWLALAGESWCN